MYEERKNKVSLRNAILVVLLVTLFIFILVWLFPTKNYLKNNTSSETYANYLVSLEDAAKNYFTSDRMPAKIGDSVKLTLGEMLEKKLVLNIEGNAKCDLNESYVEITRMDKEYQLKIVLSCEGYSNTKMVTVACSNCTTTPSKNTNTNPKPQAVTKYTVTFDSNGGSAVSAQTITKGQKASKPADPTRSGYTFAGWTLDGKAYDFNSAVNGNIKLVASWNKVEETNNNNNNNNNDDVTYVTEYQYRKAVTRTIYTPWSDWTHVQKETGGFLNADFEDTNLKQFKNFTYDVRPSAIPGNGYYEDTYSYEDYVVDVTSPIPPDYSERWEVVGSATPHTTYDYSEWSYAGETLDETGFGVDDDDTTRYEYVGIRNESSCNTCMNKSYFVYNVYTRTVTPHTTYSCSVGELDGTDCKVLVASGSKTPSCPSGYDLYYDECIKTASKQVVCHDCGDFVPETVIFIDYYYRERSEQEVTEYVYEYRTTKNSKYLLENGYELTGITRTVAH